MMMSNAFISQSRIEFSKRLPRLKGELRACSLVVYDLSLKKCSPAFRQWIKNFPHAIGVEAGESLKTLNSAQRFFEKHFESLQILQRHKGQMIVVGGGSVGDFGSFVASVYKRGVALWTIPSTWLAVIDSAHGGKNGLNLLDRKNQIGTFYPAHKVFVCPEILKSQNRQRFYEAQGEALKIAFLSSQKTGSLIVRACTSQKTFIEAIPQMIQAKARWVNADPYEKTHIRQMLNLGHTMGHVWEAALKIPHGQAVAWGLAFALDYSLHLGILSPAIHHELREMHVENLLSHLERPARLPEKTIRKLLLADKKNQSTTDVNFVFLRNWGTPLVSQISIDDFVGEVLRQGYCR